MADGYLPPSAYFAEPLGVAQLRGAQLGQMRQQRQSKEDTLAAEMEAYGAVSPRELMVKKATMTRETAEREAQSKKLEDFGNIMQDLEEMEPATRKAALADEGIRNFVGGFIDPDSISMEKEGMRFRSTSEFPGMIKLPDGNMVEGATRPGSEYIAVKTPEGEYFKEVMGTQKLAGKADSTALMMNTRFISKTLKISEAKALEMVRQSKGKSRQQFIQEFVLRVTGLMGDKAASRAASVAGDIYDEINPDKVSPGPEAPEAKEPEQDWFDATKEALFGGE